MERPDFLWGQALPEDTSRWWGGGREEAPQEDSEDEVTALDRTTGHAITGLRQRTPTIYSFTAAPTGTEDSSTGAAPADMCETAGSKKIKTEKSPSGICRARQGIKRKAPDTAEAKSRGPARDKSVKTPERPKQLEKGRSRKQIRQLRAQGRRKYTYTCPKCGGPVPSMSKATTQENSSAKEWHKLVSCRNSLCKWRGYGRKLTCFFCHRLPGACFCDGVEMFRFESAAKESLEQDFEMDRPKLTYFLLCPGHCSRRLGFPTEPHLDNMARY